MGTLALVVLTSALLAAEPAAAPSEDAAVRSAAAAEKAAEAAAKAADAAQRAADAAAKAAAAVAAPAPAAPVVPLGPLAPPAPPPGAVWTGTAAASLVSLSGNSRSIAIAVNAGVERKSESWIFGLKLTGGYGNAKAADSDEWAINALNATAQARAAYRFTPRYSAYVLAGIDTDHVASVEERPYVEGGVGILWLDVMEGDLSKLRLGTDIAFRYAREIRFRYFPTRENLDDVDIAAPRIGVAFRYALTKDVVFTEDAEVLPNVLGDARWLINSNTKISARVASPLSVYASLLVKVDTSPAPGTVDTDTALAFGVEAAF